MNKLTLFLENFFIYGIGNGISRFIPYIMTPIVVKLMPSAEEFGINDLFQTLTSFGGTIALLGMYDAFFRMYFENEALEYKKIVCSTALAFVVINSLFIAMVLMLFREDVSFCFFDDVEFGYLVIIASLIISLSSIARILSGPTRTQNNRKIYLIINTLAPIFSYGIAIFLLVKGYYFVALPIASLASELLTGLSYFTINRKWFSFRLADWNILKQLLSIAVPLFPTIFIYWIFNSVDRLMIVNMVGAKNVGIYSAGARLSHISYLIYTAFAGGWQFFAYSTMKDDDQVETNSKIFEYLGVISFIATTVSCIVSYYVFSLVFPDEYLIGFLVVPYLFLVPLLQMLFQICASQLIIIKKTWPILFYLLLGAIANIIFNFFFIPRLGIEGAAVGTFLGYSLSVLLCMFLLCLNNLLLISRRLIYLYIVFICYLFLWRLFFSKELIMGILFDGLFFIFCAYQYREEIEYLYGVIVGRIKNV